MLFKCGSKHQVQVSNYLLLHYTARSAVRCTKSHRFGLLMLFCGLLLLLQEPEASDGDALWRARLAPGFPVDVNKYVVTLLMNTGLLRKSTFVPFRDSRHRLVIRCAHSQLSPCASQEWKVAGGRDCGQQLHRLPDCLP
jgi:hypothetical protein